MFARRRSGCGYDTLDTDIRMQRRPAEGMQETGLLTHVQRLPRKIFAVGCLEMNMCLHGIRHARFSAAAARAA